MVASLSLYLPSSPHLQLYALCFLALSVASHDPTLVCCLLLPLQVLRKQETWIRIAAGLIVVLLKWYLAKFDPIAPWLFAIAMTIGLESLAAMRDYYFSPYKDSEASWFVRNSVCHTPY
jgi:hypothetical protein